jgi:hypothetical protein
MTRRNAPTWPFMIVLGFLFAMSVTSPRGWERYAQRYELRSATLAGSQTNREAQRPVSHAPTPAMGFARTGTVAETLPRTAAAVVLPRPITLSGAPPAVAAAPRPTPSATTSTPRLSQAIAASPFVNTSPVKKPAVVATATLQYRSFDAVGPAQPIPPIELAAEPTAAPIALVAPIVAPSQPVSQPEPVKQPEPIAPAASVVVAPVIAAPLVVEAPVAAPAVRTVPPLAGGVRLSGAPIAAPSASVAATPPAAKPIAASPSVAPQPAPTNVAVSAPLALGNPQPMPANIGATTPTVTQPTLTQPTLTQPTLTQPTVTQPAIVAQPAVVAQPMVLAQPTLAAQPKVAEPVVTKAPQPARPEPAKPELAKPAPAVTRPIVAEPARPIVTEVLKPATPIPAKPADIAAVPSWWPTPVDLYARLDKLRERPATKNWAERAEAVLRHLATAQDAVSPQVVGWLDDLRTVAADPSGLDESRLDAETLVELRLTRHALLRRVDVWESLSHVLRETSGDAKTVHGAAAEQLGLALGELETQTAAAGETGRQWRNYLLVDSLRRLTTGAASDGERRDVAREVLNRLSRAGTDRSHREFLRQGPFAKLDARLRDLADEEVDGRRLLAGIERFEQGGLPSDAEVLADECRVLGDSSNEAKKQLAVWLTSHYRNANVRVTFSAELLNRLMPDSLRQQAPVKDTILGLPTRGWSTARTGLNVRFLPSDDQLAIRLEAQGMVHSQTRTQSGPVRVFNNSNATFAAQKDIALSPDGVTVKRAEALSKSNSNLRGIESDYDGIPILGGIVAAIARDQHDENRSAAQREAAWKISRQVERNLDSDIEQHLRGADAALQRRVAGPMKQLRLEPEVVDLHSTEDRAVMRLRIAGNDQLGAHTPRPRAYADNFASLQIHQSAVNNIVDRLELQGRRFTPVDLYRHMVQTLQLEDRFDVSKLPTEVDWTFAKADPITVRYEDGLVELRMSLAELRHKERGWQDFIIRAQFRPEMIDGRMCFVRDGVIRLTGNGQKLPTTAQIALRTVFSKVFPDDLQVKMFPDELRSDARFADLDVEQVDIRDGWLGLSIGKRAGAVETPTTVAAPAAGQVSR